jgi:hypothetical protein
MSQELYSTVNDNDNRILLDIEPTAEYPRHTEGAFVTLRDGRVLFVYSRFGGRRDSAAADLVGLISDDGGRSWGEPFVVVENSAGFNVMSVSLLRLQDGRIALFYLRKNSMQDCRPVLCFSDDEAQSWSEPRALFSAPGYYVLHNDRVVQLESGRLVVPISYARPRSDDPQHHSAIDLRGLLLWYLSDDAGVTWREAQTWWALPHHSESGLQEPGVVELADGTLLCWARTDRRWQYCSRSLDGGEHWSSPEPSALESPLSPASMKAIPGTKNLLAIYNDHSGQFPVAKIKARTPLVAAISTDGGYSWPQRRLLEGDPDGWFCYTAIHFLNDSVLLAYNAGSAEFIRLSRMRLRRISLDWFTQQDA